MDIEQAAYEIGKILDDLSRDVVGVIASRVKTVGSIERASDIQRLVSLARVKDIKAIEKLVQNATGKTKSQVTALFKQAAEESGSWAQVYYDYRGIDLSSQSSISSALAEQLAESSTKDITALIKASAFEGKSIRQSYNDVVNQAVAAVTTGSTDYRTATRQAIIGYAKNGLTVTYPSGSTLRLDSAVRMNVSDGVSQAYEKMHEAAGKEFGADGWEISAHALCAKDHLPIQGRRYSFEEYDKLGLKRPIGTMNCHHTKYPIIMGVGEQTYTEDQLVSMKSNSNDEIVYHGVSGKELSSSRYDATQYQRKLETFIRERKDMASAAEKMGDDTMARMYNTDAGILKKAYRSMSKEAGLHVQSWRIG